MSFHLGPVDSPRLTLDEEEALAAKLIEWWGLDTNVQFEGSADMTNFGATWARRQTISFEVPDVQTNDGALGTLRRELAAIGRPDLQPELNL